MCIRDSTFKIKLANHNIRTHCGLLYIMCGNKQIRADEDGSIRLYNTKLGTWDAFDGLLSEEIIDGVELFMTRLEGLFRSFHSGTKRTADDLQGMISTVFTELPILPDGTRNLQILVDRAIFCKGDKLLEDFKEGKRAQRGSTQACQETQVPGDVADGAAAAEAVNVNYPWHIKTDHDIEKINQKMSNEVLERRLITFFAAWCKSKYDNVQGFAFV